MKKAIKYFSLILFFTGLIPQGFAQWQTQSFKLNAGWNAIYTHVDAKHTTIGQLVQGNGIEEVWMWNPKLSTLQYIQSPDQPLDNSTRWTRWQSADSSGSSMQRLIGNAAFLVKAERAVVWSIKGQPVPPRLQWTSTGLNFIGFSTLSDSPPIFSNFLNPVNGFGAGAQIFSYPGGELSATNPKEIFTLNSSNVNRGEAYWVRATGYNRYYGPFELGLQDWGGVRFGEDLSSYKIILKNTTQNELTVSMALQDSETGPNVEGVSVVAGTPPIIVRGDYNFTTLTHEYSPLNDSPKSWTLKPKGQPGSAVEIFLGAHWAKLSGSAGDLFAGILRFTDNLGYLQTDLPLSVIKPSTTGLWVGEASVNKVRHGMQIFKKSIVEGEAKAAVVGTTSNPITVSWLKREAVQTKLDGETYVSSDAGYHLIKTKSYTNVSVGDALWLPPEDENDNLLTAPENYWLARPHHEAFVQGWYYTQSTGFVVATGDKSVIDMKFVKRFAPNLPSGFTVVEDPSTSEWHYMQDKDYLAVLQGDALEPPANDEDGTALAVPLDYWEVISGTMQGDGTPAWGGGASGINAKIPGNITLKWRKISPESTVYEWVTIDNDQQTLLEHEYKTVSKSVTQDQRLSEIEIFTSENMTPGDWFIMNTPYRPPFDWEGTKVQADSGSYVVAHTDTSWGSVAKPMSLRLIVHNNAATTPVANLLQRVYIGINKNNGSQLLSTGVGLLPESMPKIRRVSSVHLPWSEANLPWEFSGSFAKGGTLRATVTVAHDDHASNPFLHTYHPDHDNLDSRFEEKLKQGQESFEIKREIILRLGGSLPGFKGLTQGGSSILGEYEEIITLTGKAKLSGAGYEKRQYGMNGIVAFKRITPVNTLRTE